jgi:sRNA-binding regulator protein Hfq
MSNQEMSDKNLESLLEKARDNNKKSEITGMLLYRNGFFMQALEGELESIEKLFATISKDVRHRNVILVYKDAIETRRFPDWTMGFNRLDTDNTRIINGYTDFLQQPTPDFFIQYASDVDILLDSFKP